MQKLPEVTPHKGFNFTLQSDEDGKPNFTTNDIIDKLNEIIDWINKMDAAITGKEDPKVKPIIIPEPIHRKTIKRGGPLGDGDYYPSREKMMKNNPAV